MSNQPLTVALLRPDSTRREAMALCEKYAQTADSVCVLPTWVADVLESELEVATVIGWPYGAANSQALGVEAAMATADGALELILFPNLSALKSGAELLVADAVQTVVDAAAPAGAEVTLWLPWEQLQPLERQSLARLAVECGANALLLPVDDEESAKALREFLPEEIGMIIACAATSPSAAYAHRLWSEWDGKS
ncbi:hypothetical protein [Armatimonas sp.]|uniref:hypothetical protein n=1 Tax=Armatimonas sp. TaxID=1872638 RepID=UPI0037537D72